MEHLPEVLPAEAPLCVHHWMLGAPVGGVTSGLCRVCGEVKEFTEGRAAHPYIGRGRRK